MLEKSFGLFFFLKQPKNQTSTRYVYLRITVDGIPKELSTKRIWYPDRWNQSAGRATGTKEDAKSLNAYLETIYAKVFQAKAALLESGKPITAENLKNVVTGKGDERRMLLNLLEEHNKQLKSLIGIDFAPATLSRYETTLKNTREFIEWKYAISDIDINDLNYEFVSDFSYWLKTAKKCGHNSVVKYITNVKKIILQCIKKGWLNRDPFIEFKTTRKEVHITPLNSSEIEAISNKLFCTDRLNFVKDIFIFSCYTGLAYADVKALKHTNIITGEDGEQWIITQRQKTESPTRLPLLPKAIEILEKYRGHEKCSDGNHVLPVLTNQKMNAYLKEIADLCGITKKLTFHIARHSFATTITLSNGVPLETVSSMLGHSSVKQTQHYAKIVDLKKSHDMAELKLKLANK